MAMVSGFNGLWLFACVVSCAAALADVTDDMSADAMSTRADTCDGEGAGCAADEASMLQRQRLRTSAGVGVQQIPGEKRTALCFEGGGWLAMTSYIGTLTGVTAVVNPSGKVTDTLKDVDIISSTSGGTWLQVSMVYSDPFMNWMNEIKDAANDPQKISSLWGEWTAKAQSALPVCSLWKTVEYTAGLMAKWISMGMSQHEHRFRKLQRDSFLLKQAAKSADRDRDGKAALLEEGANPGGAVGALLYGWMESCQWFYNSWDYTIQTMLNATAGIGQQVATGSGSHGTWMDGKTMVLAMTVPARTQTTNYPPAEPRNFVGVRAFWQEQGGIDIMYTPSGDNVPQYIPAKVAYTLGSNAQPSRGFCATADCFNLSFTYTSVPKFNKTVQMAPMMEDIMVAQASQVPITHFAAASSAWDGIDAVAHSPVGTVYILGQAAVWAANATDGKTFDNGLPLIRSVVDEPLLVASEKAVNAGMFPIIDGAYSDNTGVLQAIAAGATNVVSFQVVYPGEPNFWYTFTKDGMYNVGQVFEETQEQVEAEYNASAIKLKGPTNSSLQELSFFQKTLTTVRNDNFGIELGRRVKLTLVVSTTGLYMGPPVTQLSKFGDFMGYITATLIANPDVAQKIADALR